MLEGGQLKKSLTIEQLRKPLLLFCIIQVCFRRAFAACILAFAEGVVLCGAFAAAFAAIRFRLGNSIGILYNKVIDLYTLGVKDHKKNGL